MNEIELLNKHYKKMKTAALIRSVILGLVVSFAVCAALGIAVWISALNGAKFSFNPTPVIILAGVPVFALSFLLFYRLKYRPTLKKAAVDLDRGGLEERAVTALEYSGADTEIAGIQRNDFSEKLSRLPGHKLTIKTFGKAALTAAMLLICFTVILLLPNLMGLYGRANAKSDGFDEWFSELVEELKEEIGNDELVSEKFKEELMDEVASLEEDIAEMRGDPESTREDMEAEAAERAEDIREQLDTERVHMMIAAELQEHENTEDLGNAVQNGDKEAVNEALDEMRENIDQAASQNDQSLREELQALAESLDRAAEKGREGDELTEALKNLSEQIKEAGQKADGTEQNDQEARGRADNALEEAKEEISDALGNKGKKDENRDNGENGDDEKEPKEDVPPENGAGSSGDPEDNNGGMPGGDDRYAVSYIDGETPYTDRFDDYYTEEMERLANSEIDEELKQLAARYYAAMRVKTENGDGEN